MNADSICRQIFQGVFSADTLPSKPRLLVCPSTKPGRHWIAIYVDEDGGREYFDSFGRKETSIRTNIVGNGFSARNSYRAAFVDFIAVCTACLDVEE
jgi:hypothetical protein